MNPASRQPILTRKLPFVKPRSQQKETTFRKIGPDVLKLITTTIRDVEDDNGWAYLGEVGGLLKKQPPSTREISVLKN